MPEKLILTEAQNDKILVMRAAGKPWEEIAKCVGVSTWRVITAGKDLGIWHYNPGRGNSRGWRALAGAQNASRLAANSTIDQMKREDFDMGDALPANHPYALRILESAATFEARWGSD